MPTIEALMDGIGVIVQLARWATRPEDVREAIRQIRRELARIEAVLDGRPSDAL